MKKYLLSLFITVLFLGCGGGGGGSSSSTTVTGTFVDSPVEGLRYECSSGAFGITNSFGQYTCNSGDSVTFYIGDITIGTTSASTSSITPYTLFPADSTAAINLARLLQSIDLDNDPTNGIVLNDVHIASLPNNLSFSSGTFDTDVESRLNIIMVNANDAMDHLDETILSLSFAQSDKDFLYNLFNTEYYWADNVIAQNYDNFRTPQAMINALKYDTLDRWSYSQSIEDYENRANQITAGFGSVVVGDIVYIVDFGSPAELSGLKRGDQILEINNQPLSANVYYNSEYNTGVASLFRVKRGADILEISITPADYNYEVLKPAIFEAANGKKVGHIIYESFTSASIAEIESAFTEFKNNNVEELIIDLRYNGGGSIATASILLDKIAGLRRDGLPQISLEWNNNYQVNNESFEFVEDGNSLDIDRVFILTTQYTASASEMVINALTPYLNEVITIGDTTRGKPVGMRGKERSNIIYWLINFSVYNALGQGDYFNGIVPDCVANDDVQYQRDEVDDTMLNEALYYIDNGVCGNGNQAAIYTKLP